MSHSKVIPLFILSAVVLLGSFLLYLALPEIVIKQIQKRAIIKPGSPIYKVWRDAPIPIYQKFYMFNITNPTEVEHTGTKPIVQELGPFTYRMWLFKRKIKFHENDTVSYRELKRWKFQPHLSAFDENTMITTVNTPLVSTLTVLQRLPPPLRILITTALDTITEGVFIRRTVKQLTFEGYPDLLVTFGPMIDPKVPTNHGRFGYLFPRNNTEDGVFNVYTGKNDPSKLNVIDLLNGRPNLNSWKSDECNSLNNTFNGQLHPSLIDNFIPNYQFFNELFGRKFNLRFKGITEPYKGVKAYRFVFDDNNLKNSIDYPPNACYTSRLNADLIPPVSSSRRSPTGSLQLPQPSALLNLARRRLTENGGLFSRNSLDRATPLDETSSTGTSSTPAGQAARQALRVLGNTLATRTLEQLGRLGERIAPPANRLLSAPLPETRRADYRENASDDSAVPVPMPVPVPVPTAAALSKENQNMAERIPLENTELPTFVTASTPLPAGFIPNIINAARQRPILSGLFASREQRLDSAREIARNITQNAPLNSMLSSVLNSGLVSRLLSIRRDARSETFRPDMLNRSKRQAERRDGRLQRRQTEPSEFAKLRTMNKFPSGAFDFSQMAFGAPILLSLPHFLNADSFYTNQVIGLKANKTRHNFFFDIDPITGASVNTAMRFQLNLALLKTSGLSLRFRNLGDRVFPILWQEVILEMPDDQKFMLRLMNMAPETSAQVMLLIGGVISLLLLGIAIKLHFSQKDKVLEEIPARTSPRSLPSFTRSLRRSDSEVSASQDYHEDNDHRKLHPSGRSAVHGIDNPVAVEP